MLKLDTFIPRNLKDASRRHKNTRLALAPLRKHLGPHSLGQRGPNEEAAHHIPLALRQRDAQRAQVPQHRIDEHGVPRRIRRPQHLADVLLHDAGPEQAVHVRRRQLRGRAARARGPGLRDAVSEFRAALAPADADAGPADFAEGAVAHCVAEAIRACTLCTAGKRAVNVNETGQDGFV